ncbi:hypothetical protein BT69DRAFT_1350303 [Atractiella rhizophila]|nr:hypothetical protein BT69DRAFT_1350303 [Atractiella rhizophila]
MGRKEDEKGKMKAKGTVDVLPLVASPRSLSLSRTQKGVLLLVLLTFSFFSRPFLRSVSLPQHPASSPRLTHDVKSETASERISEDDVKSYEHYEALVSSRTSAWGSVEEWRADLNMTDGNGSGGGGGKVSAVLLAWKRDIKYHQLSVLHLLRYPWIGEVIIWNNDPNRPLSLSNFSHLPSPHRTPLRIYNAPSNTHDLSKHLACSLALHSSCYFADEDWLNLHIEAGYTKYLACCSPSASPSTHPLPLSTGRGTGNGRGRGREEWNGRISGNTMPYIAWEHRRWRFFDPTLSLDSSFTWLGTGSFSPRELSKRFLKQIDALEDPFLFGARERGRGGREAKENGLGLAVAKEEKMVADMFFSIWTNDRVEQMSNDLTPVVLDDQKVGWSEGLGEDQWTIVYRNILKATATLHRVLTLRHPVLVPTLFPPSSSSLSSYGDDDDIVEEEEEGGKGRRGAESDMKSPCADDSCLFITSLTPFPMVPSLQDLSSSLTLKTNLKTSLKSNFKSFKQKSLFPIDHMNEYEAFVSSRSGFPTVDWWLHKGSWHLAVDSEGDDTCWFSSSARGAKKGDYVGLAFVKARSLTGNVALRVVGSLDEEGWGVQYVESVAPGGLGGVEDWASLFTFSILCMKRVDVEANWEKEGEATMVRFEEGEIKGERWKKVRFVKKSGGEEEVRICDLRAIEQGSSAY